MSYASALDFITTTTDNLTKEKIDLLGTPLLPSGTKLAADNSIRLVSEERMTAVSDDSDEFADYMKQMIAELSNLSFTFLFKLAAVLEIVPAQEVPALITAYSAILNSEEEATEADEELVKGIAQSNAAFGQLQYSMNVEGLPIGSASIRLGGLLVARYFDVPCPVADAEEIYATVMGA
jgi:hypothetical protein